MSAQLNQRYTDTRKLEEVIKKMKLEEDRYATMHTASVCLMLVEFLYLSPSKHGKSHQQSIAVAHINTTSSSWSLLPHYITDHEEMWIVLQWQPSQDVYMAYAHTNNILRRILVPEMHLTANSAPGSPISNHRSRKA
jgi:hypothetical protein